MTWCRLKGLYGSSRDLRRRCSQDPLKSFVMHEVIMMLCVLHRHECVSDARTISTAKARYLVNEHSVFTVLHEATSIEASVFFVFIFSC
jgi:hypothetical protein